jgi:hypothetical protein
MKKAAGASTKIPAVATMTARRRELATAMAKTAIASPASAARVEVITNATPIKTTDEARKTAAAEVFFGSAKNNPIARAAIN